VSRSRFASPKPFEASGTRPRVPTRCGLQGRALRMFEDKFLQPRLLAFALLLSLANGCRTAPPLAKADFSEPGWTLHQGQAVWRSKRDAVEIAGEILLATNLNGRSLVQFTKTPFPFVTAQTTTNIWQIEAPVENRRFSGRGSPPARVIWFQLPRAYAGLPVPERWSWRSTSNNWRLENVSTGELLEGYFEPAPP
jgi:hypothetical protein